MNAESGIVGTHNRLGEVANAPFGSTRVGTCSVPLAIIFGVSVVGVEALWTAFLGWLLIRLCC
jgi:hypothetical protein